MQLLNFFNIKNRSLTSVIEPFTSLLEVGDTFKINSILVSKIEIKEKTTPIKYSKKKLNDFKYWLADRLISLANWLKGIKKEKPTEIKYRYPWWK